MNKDLIAIFDYMEKEKGIQRATIISAIESALKIAAKKTLRDDANISVNINSRTGDIEVFCEKEIVDICLNPSKEIPLDKAREFDPDCEIGQYMDVPFVSENFGRIAAHAARQIIGQKLRHAEKDVIYEEYRHHVNKIFSGIVKRFVKGSNLIVDLGKVEAILPARFYPKTEKHKIGDKIYALLYEVQESDNGGAEVILSRSHPEFVKQLFMQEVPELEEGSVSIVKIAREAGYRTKLAVSSSDFKTDSVGAFVGMRGARVKNIIRELNDEKIDIVNYSSITTELLQNLLYPIEIQKIAILEDDKVIAIVVNDADYATVIGKRGINARLISQILNYELEVQRMSEYNKLLEIQRLQLAEFDNPQLDRPLEIEGINRLVVQNLEHAGYDTIRKVLLASANDLASVPGICLELAYKILEQVSKYGEDKVDEKPETEN
ncbi:transcription termination factor NusA [Chlamydia sp. 17-3921]|uniref:transcription termination factor NusA n=1 Tax=Chlamydia sp. 17-3921 TaxID=2675798 RepID=UPI001917F31A|nr:transcription termination factor NusA [Chlamydia sp. 17-3921]